MEVVEVKAKLLPHPPQPGRWYSAMTCQLHLILFCRVFFYCCYHGRLNVGHVSAPAAVQ